MLEIPITQDNQALWSGGYVLIPLIQECQLGLALIEIQSQDGRRESIRRVSQVTRTQ